MDSNFTYAVSNADKYQKEEMLEYLLGSMSGTYAFNDAMKAKVFIEYMGKYSVEELEKRLKK